jgi:hypothetical protein
MPTPNTYNFTYKELASLMIKAAGVREGFWGIRVSFGMKGTNIGPDKNQIVPGALLLVQDIALQRFDEENALSVDAATVWEKKDDEDQEAEK